MLVTIYTDASWTPDLAAGAAWIRSEEGLIKLRKRYESVDSAHAEGAMIYFAVKKALQEWDNVSVVLINSDHLGFVRYLNVTHPTVPKREDLQKGVNLIFDMCNSRGVLIRTRHIKGHQGGHNSRSWLNEWCDTQARKARRGRA